MGARLGRVAMAATMAVKVGYCVNGGVLVKECYCYSSMIFELPPK